MKRLLQRLLWLVLLPVRIVAAPFRWIAKRWRAARDFFSEVPEDVSLTETIGQALGDRGTLRETIAGLSVHIEALRMHLLRSVIVLALTTGLSFLFARDLMIILAQPLQDHGGLEALQTIEPTEAVGVFMRVSLLAGVAFSMPWIVLEVYLFVAPGLMPHSRLLLAGAIPAASLLFLLGMAFTYYVMLPTAIPFLFTFLDFKSAWRPSAYFGLVTSLMFWIGLAFQMPLVVYALAAVGLIRARQLARQWRLAVVIIAVIAAAVTPTVDPVNMGLVMLPMVLLYGFSIVGAAIASRGHDREARARAARANLVR